MRIGFNPLKDKPLEESGYLHQIIIPVFIPNHQGYFKDSFKILQLCLNSVFRTIHDKTWVTVVNNGSDKIIVDYLDELYRENKIHELIHTQNIGKLNAILKGLSGNNIELVTIADSDVLFLSHWQIETNRVFAAFPKAGVVGIVPQYRSFAINCYNTIVDHFFDKKLQFIPVKNPEALKHFYASIGWNDNSNPDYLKVSLGMVGGNDFKVYLGSGHFVATYKKDMFEEIVTYIGYKMGGDSESYLDAISLNKDYWRLTTHDNYAYHMGNSHESWMDEVTFIKDETDDFQSDFHTFKKINKVHFYIKNHIFRKLFKNKRLRRWFYRFKKMPAAMVSKY